jgi:phage tail sheath protein FI
MAEAIISPGVFTRENDISFIQPAPVEAGAAIIGPAVKGPVEKPTLVTSYNDYVRTFGATFESASTSYEFMTSLAVKNYFSQGGNSVLVSRIVSGAYDSATSTHISSSDNASIQPFTLETLGEGTIFNNSTGLEDSGSQNSDGSLVSGSSDNLRWEVSNISTSQGTFSLSVRQGDDNTKSKIILETFNNVSLDPNSTNYIEAVIGNQSSTLVDGADGTYIRTSGEYVNRSKYVRISAVNLKTIDYLSTDGITINTDSNGGSYSGSLPIAGAGAFFGAQGDIKAGANLFENISNTNTQGLVADNYTSIINLLTNTEEYVFNIISAPGLSYTNATHITPIDSIVSLAEGRGDCIAVVDVQNYEATVSNVVAKATSINSSYAATYWPWLQVLSATGRNEWVPASVVIPGVYAFTDNSSAPWFAPAGLVRGGVAGVIQAERRLTRTQRDTLYSNKVNPIASFPGQGISVFGQKTLQTKASALDRVNVRRLLIELKKFIGDESRNLVFEQNTIATRNRFLATVNPYLESVVQRQGLYAYRVVMDDSNNTADVVDRNQLIGQIFIQPVKTAEFIILDFTIEPTGATFAG